MRTIFKYQISNDSHIDLPHGAEVLHMSWRQGNLWIWCLVESTITVTERRHFMTFKTGVNIPPHLNLKYIGTCKLISDLEVYHAFEEIKTITT